MNARILELIKNPEIIQSEDLNLLESEIKAKPYIQNIRALYLYGTHQFNPENYQKELSKTAAYTTDKKILYQFITKKTVTETFEETQIPDNKDLDNQEVDAEQKSIVNKFDTEKIIEVKEKEELKPVFINGERNRILFEGEEDFLDRPSEKIDLQATLESGTIITESVKEDVEEIKNESHEGNIEISELEKSSIETELSTSENKFESFDNDYIEDESFDEVEHQTSDLEVEKNEGKVEELAEDNSSDLSFHGIEDFMPNVSVSKPKPIEKYQPKPAVNKHEEEMQRLIAEVKAKIKAKKEAQKLEEKKSVEEEVTSNNEINFAETPSFEVKKEDEVETISEKEEQTETSIVEEQPTHEISEQNQDWKPMSFESNKPDALIDKSEKEVNVVEKSDNKKSETSTSEPESKSEERPVFNVSFFSPDVSKIEEEEVIETKQESNTESKQSNVPQFINTWQNWLKIERVEPQPNKEEIKEKAIESFIENEPKISKLKEESTFVIKEKDDDISHLMTETFAKLYVEQRLYTKAIKAFEILIGKHPEKKDYFEEKIKEIKSIRSGGNAS